MTARIIQFPQRQASAKNQNTDSGRSFLDGFAAQIHAQLEIQALPNATARDADRICASYGLEDWQVQLIKGIVFKA